MQDHNRPSRFLSPSYFIQSTLENTFHTNGDGNTYNVTQSVEVNTASAVVLKFLFGVLVFVGQMIIGIVLLVVLGTLWVIVTLGGLAWTGIVKLTEKGEVL